MSNQHFETTNKDLELQISLEKRKRVQLYTSLDYFSSSLTYFDFFSVDTFKILLDAKYLTQACGKEILTSDFLLIPFFNFNFEISKILERHNVIKKDIGSILSKSFDFKKIKGLNKFQSPFSFPFLKKENVSLDQIKCSQESYRLFEKAAENALNRFKTPIINVEILFITLMEEKDTKVGKLIQSFLKNETEWYVLRYKLLKRLHEQETYIRTEVKRNQHYFAYLLKKNLPEFHFQRLIDNNEYEYVSLGVLFFRKEVIKSLLSIDLLDNVYLDVFKSNKFTKKRTYSS